MSDIHAEDRAFKSTFFFLHDTKPKHCNNRPASYRPYPPPSFLAPPSPPLRPRHSPYGVRSTELQNRSFPTTDSPLSCPGHHLQKKERKKEKKRKTAACPTPITRTSSSSTNVLRMRKVRMLISPLHVYTYLPFGLSSSGLVVEKER